MVDEPIPVPGLTIHKLVTHVDPRGSLFEVFNPSWGLTAMHQWTAMTLARRALRGPSVHRRHTDAVVALEGEMSVGLRDLRERSPVFRRPFRVTLSSRVPTLLVIPPGVMHAFHAPHGPALVMVGGSFAYDPDDDIKCRSQDAALDLDPSDIGLEDGRARSLEDVIAALRATA
jgi:dTDP-4-dehydrorhamnose 3,5-epimerase-like enzyme